MHAIAEPIAALWERTRAMFARAIAVIGPPDAIASVRVLAENRRRLVAQWLGLLEHIVRKLLLAEAAKVVVLSQSKHARKPLAGRSAGLLARTSASATGRCGPGGSSLDPSRPETWPARFSLTIPRDPLTVPPSRAPRIRALWGDAPKESDTHASVAEPVPTPTARMGHSVALARRFEALRRVLKDHAPHARRLARLLLRLRRRFPEVIRRFAVAAARVSFFDPSDDRLSIHAGAAALDAADSFADSS